MAKKLDPTNTAPKGSSTLAALFRVLGTVIITVIVIIGLPATVPRLFGYQTYNIVSGSMEPTIPVGAAVYAKYIDPEYLVEGDIIAYNAEGDVIVHRLTVNDSSDGTVRAKGDANDAEDMWAIPYDEILGRVKVSVKFLGSILDYATSSKGKLYILVILFAGVMFSVLGKMLAPKDETDTGKPKAVPAKDGGKEGMPVKAQKPLAKGKKGKKAAAAAASGGATLTVDAAVLDAKAKENGKAPSKPAEEAYPEPDKVITTNDLPDKAEPSKAPAKPQKGDKKAAKAEAKRRQAEEKKARAEAAKAAKAAKSGKGKPDNAETSDKQEKSEAPKKPVKPSKADKKEEKAAQKASAKQAKDAEKDIKNDSNSDEGIPDEELEKYKKAIKVIVLIVIALILAVLVVGGIKIYRYNKERNINNSAQQFTQKAAEPEPVADEEPPPEPEPEEEETWHLDVTEPCPIDIDFESLWEINEDVIAWLYCEDTVINYPVLQGEDNDYYLHHSYDHKQTAAGSLFIDCNNMSDFSDVNTIIYGHHMKDGSMFAGLQKWEEQEYYDAHKYMWLITPEANYQVWMFSGYLTDAYNDEVYVGIREWSEPAAEYITTAYNGSDFSADVPLDDLLRGDAETDQHYIMLSTCEYEFANARYVLHGKLVKEYK